MAVRSSVTPLQLGRLAVLGFLGSVATLFFVPLLWWLECVLPIAAALILSPFVVGQSRPFKEASRRFRELERGYPSIIVRLERIGEAPPV